MLIELDTMPWDFVCFSETRATSTDITLEGNHRLIAHRGNSYGGVAILINSIWSDKTKCARTFGDRVLAVQALLKW